MISSYDTTLREWEKMTDRVTGEQSDALFISKTCECHYILPYGFVPEADCPTHDTKEFCAFIRSALTAARKEAIRETVSSPDAPPEIKAMFTAAEERGREENHLLWCSVVEEKLTTEQIESIYQAVCARSLGGKEVKE